MLEEHGRSCLAWGVCGDPTTFPPGQDVRGHDFCCQTSRSELRQWRTVLRNNFVDVCADNDDVGVGEQGLDGLNRLPVAQAARNGRTGCRNQGPVESVDVKGQMNGSRKLPEFLKPATPDSRARVRVLCVSSEVRGDSVVAADSFRLVLAVGTDTRLENSANAHVKAAACSAGMGKNLAAQFLSEVGVSVELNHCERFQILVHGRMSSGCVHDGWKNAVLSAQKQRKNVAFKKPNGVVGELVKLPSQRRGRSLPHRFSDDVDACGQVRIQSIVVKFDLATRLDAGSWSIASSGPVRRRQFVRQGDNRNVCRPPFGCQTKEGSLNEVLRHAGRRRSRPSSSCRWPFGPDIRSQRTDFMKEQGTVNMGR